MPERIGLLKPDQLNLVPAAAEVNRQKSGRRAATRDSVTGPWIYDCGAFHRLANTMLVLPGGRHESHGEDQDMLAGRQGNTAHNPVAFEVERVSVEMKRMIAVSYTHLVMRSHAQTTFSDTEVEIGEAVDFVVHVERQPGRRIVREVLALRGYDRDAKRFLIEPVFEVQYATP